MDTADVDMTASARRGDVLEATVQLTAPRSQLAVALPAGEAGRAEAVIETRSWGAKHYWRREPGVMVYEFDEPLPAGPVLLRIPIRP